jgi:hypothetical protein
MRVKTLLVVVQFSVCALLIGCDKQDELVLHIESNAQWIVYDNGSEREWTGVGNGEVSFGETSDRKCVRVTIRGSFDGARVAAWFEPHGGEGEIIGTGSRSAYERNRLRAGFQICGDAN